MTMGGEKNKRSRDSVIRELELSEVNIKLGKDKTETVTHCHKQFVCCIPALRQDYIHSDCVWVTVMTGHKQ